MAISIAIVYFSLLIPVGGEVITIDFGVYPYLGSVLYNTNLSGTATPIGYWYNSRIDSPTVHMEELSHINQMEALGPLFPIAYLIQPRFFEPYDRDTLAGSVELRCIVPHCMWSPPEEIERQFPQFRVTFNDEGVKWDFLPGYVPFLRSLTSWLN